MKRHTWIAALCSLAIGGAATAQGGTGSSAPPDQGMNAPAREKPSKPGTFSSTQLTGRLSSIDKDAGEVTIDHAGQTQVLKLGDNTTVFTEGRLGSIEDLKEGQQVRAAFEEKGGERTLRWIEVNPSGGKAQPQGSNEGTGAMGGAAAGGAAAGGAGGSPAAKNQVTGAVVSVDPARNQVVVEQAGKQWTVDVPANAPIFIEGRRATLSELREGQQVRTSLDPSKSTKTATRIETIGPSDTSRPGQKMP